MKIATGLALSLAAGTLSGGPLPALQLPASRSRGSITRPPIHGGIISPGPRAPRIPPPPVRVRPHQLPPPKPNPAAPAPVVIPQAIGRTLEVAAGSGRKLVVDLAKATVKEIQGGKHVEGTVRILTPLGWLDLLDAKLAITATTFDGQAAVPFPNVGAFAGAQIQDPAMAEVGFDFGKNLAHLDAPLLDDTKYLYFHYQTGFAAELGNFSVELPGGGGATVILDPSDPFFYGAGDLPGLGGFEAIEDLALGLSAHGRIPFHPLVTWGIEAVAKPHSGHIFLSGSVPLADLPLAIEGEGVVHLTPIGKALVPNVCGMNGTLNLTFPVVKFVDFTMALGNATAMLALNGKDSTASFSGEYHPDTAFLGQLVPILPRQEFKVAGYLEAKDPLNSFLKAQGHFGLGLTALGKRIGLKFQNLDLADSELSISRHGIYLRGRAGGAISPHFTPQGDLDVEAYFSPDKPKTDWYVHLRGHIGVGDVDLGADALVDIGPGGAKISGGYRTPVNHVAVSGEITSKGAQLTGEIDVTIPVKGAGVVAQWVTDGAVCGYEYTSSGARCGYDQVTDGAECGYHTVSDAARCGTEKITDGAKCGWDIIKDIVGLITKHKKKAKSCDVARSCKVATSCKVAKSCKDLSKPKHCEKKVRVPDAPLGDFEGRISLTIGTSGAGGTVDGEYCNGGCRKLVGGSVKLGKAPRACIAIPAVGDVCTDF